LLFYLNKISESKEKIRKANQFSFIPNSIELALAIGLKEKHFKLFSEILETLGDHKKSEKSDLLQNLY
jgi:hypothetical protein